MKQITWPTWTAAALTGLCIVASAGPVPTSVCAAGLALGLTLDLTRSRRAARRR